MVHNTIKEQVSYMIDNDKWKEVPTDPEGKPLDPEQMNENNNTEDDILADALRYQKEEEAKGEESMEMPEPPKDKEDEEYVFRI